MNENNVSVSFYFENYDWEESTHRIVERETRKITAFISIGIIFIGLIGHWLTIIVLGQKRFRKNPSHVYLLCLALNDSFFLCMHFFEDTIKSLNESYSKQFDAMNPILVNFMVRLNILENFEIACRLINYLRNVLR